MNEMEIGTPKTTTEADALFDALALLELDLQAQGEALKAEIARLNDAHAEATAERRGRRDALRNALEAFVTTRRDLFRDPRKRVRENGSYGLQSSTRVELDEGFDAEAEEARTGLELTTKKTTPDKRAIRKAAEAGLLRGARIVTAEEPVFAFNKRQAAPGLSASRRSRDRGR